MCGIAGVVDFRDSASSPQLVQSAVQTIVHRGPDARNVWSDGPVSMGHARLSIIDLSSAADQPMQDGSGQFAIAFNGEIYNYRDLRAQLASRGSVFRTNSDTEVFLESFKVWGTGALRRVRGMYAVALWDQCSRTMILARDPLGIKPLFYRHDELRLEFASEIKALLAMHPSASWHIDPEALHQYLWFGNVLGRNTMYRDIRRLEAGTYLTFDCSGCRRDAFWRVADIRPVDDDFDVATAKVRALLKDAVHSHLVSDVPVGVMLSGGIDSSAIATFAARACSAPLSTYSVAFDFDDTGELPQAAKLAQQLGTEHHELFVQTAELVSLVEKMVDSHDEPFADAANIPLYLATRQLGSGIKVVLQGDGGDEMFAGYRRYALLDRRGPWLLLRALTRTFIPNRLDLPDSLRRVLRMTEALGAPDPLRFALLLTVDSERHVPEQVMSGALRQQLRTSDPFSRYRELWQSMPVSDDVQRMLWIDACAVLPDTFLEKVDRATMANGTEVRVPFLDLNLAEYALALPSRYKVYGGERKRILRAALRGVVPDEVLDRPKRGFGVPYGKWLRGPLHNLLRDHLHDSRVIRDGLLDSKRLVGLLEDHRAGRRDHGFLLWKALQLAVWYERYPVSVDA